jgi:A/G-specific adenine glycosylase
VRQDPYLVWISEIMLQQTTVATVLPYFTRFLATFPTVTALAHASRDTVLQVWQGLGYYARVRHLHQTAQILEEREGIFPQTTIALQALPGIGPYTAAAIASMAFGVPVLARDANVNRLLSRLSREAGDFVTGDLFSRSVLPGDINQALMDIGALYCRARETACLSCPLRDFCAMYREKRGQKIRPIPKIKSKSRRYAVFFYVQAQDCLLLERRPERGLLGGLYGLPTTSWKKEETEEAPPSALSFLSSWQEGPSFIYHFTHFLLHVRVQKAQLSQLVPFSRPDWFWVPKEQLSHHALPTVFRKAL